VQATLASPGFPIRVVFTPDGRHALVSNARAGTLAIFDAASGAAVATVDVTPEGVEIRDTMLGKAALPIGIAVHPDGRRAYVAVSGADRIAVIDTGTWAVVDHWTTGSEPDALGIVLKEAPGAGNGGGPAD
jgi:YVTN family beta-propeller protein